MMKIDEIQQAPQARITEVNCDMDGVIAHFQQGVLKVFPSFEEGRTEAVKKQDRLMWAAITKHQKEGNHFWYELEPMPDAHELWNFIKPYNPYILSAAGQPHFKAMEQKIRWLNKYFQVPEDRIRIVQRSHEKAQYAHPGAVLIDDKRKALDPWIEAGGIGVLHTSAANSIAQMKRLGL